MTTIILTFVVPAAAAIGGFVAMYWALGGRDSAFGRRVARDGFWRAMFR